MANDLHTTWSCSRGPFEGMKPVSTRATWPAVYTTLLAAFGPQGWWPAASVWEIVAGAILTQGTAWVNAERALAGLRRAGWMDPQALLGAGESRLEEVVRPAGYPRRKASTLRAAAAEVERAGSLAAWLDSGWRLPDGELRARLLGLPGIGPETADCILLYAAGRPAFVADAYARRAGERLGLVPPGTSYDDARRRALASWSPSPGAAALAEAHALLVELGKRHCRKRAPVCAPCPLLGMCPTGVARAAQSLPAGASRARPAHSRRAGRPA